MSEYESEPEFHTRASERERMLRYQQNELHGLCARMKQLDTQIAVLEGQVAHNTNVMSAARGLVGMRRRCQPPPRNKVSSRSRAKQRCWSNVDGTITHASEHSSELPSLHLKPIGIIYSTFHKRFEAPRQSFTGVSRGAEVFLSESPQCRQSLAQSNLRSLKTGMRVWLIYWFDRNSGLWRNSVRPPRAKNGWRIGVFATRSPNRPSPVGLTLARVDHVDVARGIVTVSGIDVLDETPLLGLKAYNPEFDAHPLTTSGWLDDSRRLQPLYYDPMTHKEGIPDIAVSNTAKAKLEFLDVRSTIDMQFMVQESLKRLVGNKSEPQAPGCRNRNDVLPVGSFRIHFKWASEGKLLITDVVSGLRSEVCANEAYSDPEVRFHMDFCRAFQDADTGHYGR